MLKKKRPQKKKKKKKEGMNNGRGLEREWGIQGEGREG